MCGGMRADSINAINYGVRNKISPKRAMRKFASKGKKILDEVEAHIQSIFNPREIRGSTLPDWNDFHTEHIKEKTVIYIPNKANADFADVNPSMAKTSPPKKLRFF